MNTLTRRREGYHDKIAHAAADTAGGQAKTIHDRVVVKEEGLQRHLQYDWYERASLLDHFLETGVDLASFMCSEYQKSGDFVRGGYTASMRKQKDAVVLVLEREGTAAGLQVRLRKTLLLRPSHPEFVVRYELANEDREELNTTFGSEFNFSLLAGNAHDRYYEIPGHVLDKRNLASTGETNNVDQVSLVDEWLNLKVTLEFSQPAILWRAPVETVSQSEAGFERVYQSSMVMPLWRISLGPETAWEIVGVVVDEKGNGLENPTDVGAYAAFAQNPVITQRHAYEGKERPTAQLATVFSKILAPLANQWTFIQKVDGKSVRGLFESGCCDVVCCPADDRFLSNSG
jgi:alpha-amylase